VAYESLHRCIVQPWMTPEVSVFPLRQSSGPQLITRRRQSLITLAKPPPFRRLFDQLDIVDVYMVPPVPRIASIFLCLFRSCANGSFPTTEECLPLPPLLKSSSSRHQASIQLIFHFDMLQATAGPMTGARLRRVCFMDQRAPFRHNFSPPPSKESE